jgi:hypothetical protein
MLLGRRTRCIACGRVFMAGETPPPAEPPGYPVRLDDEEVPTAPPPLSRGLPRHQLPLCPRCHRPVGWEVSMCPHCGHLFADESPGQAPPWTHPWSLRRDGERHRGKLIDTLGAVSLLCGFFAWCLPFVGSAVALATGIPALVMASADLDRMREGLIDPEGRPSTEMGRDKARGGVVLAILAGTFYVFVFIAQWH